MEKEPKLIFRYIGTDHHVTDFDFQLLLEAIEAAKGAFAYQYKQDKTRDCYTVVYCDDKNDIPECCKEVDITNG